MPVSFISCFIEVSMVSKQKWLVDCVESLPVLSNDPMVVVVPVLSNGCGGSGFLLACKDLGGRPFIPCLCFLKYFFPLFKPGWVHSGSVSCSSRSFRKMPHRRATDTEPMDRILLWAVQPQGQWRSISTELSPDGQRMAQVIKLPQRMATPSFAEKWRLQYNHWRKGSQLESTTSQQNWSKQVKRI